jgi:hypothetical protein
MLAAELELSAIDPILEESRLLLEISEALGGNRDAGNLSNAMMIERFKDSPRADASLISEVPALESRLQADAREASKGLG